MSTYEVSKAQQSTARQPDPIHWSRPAAFRDSPYRQLHHQRGLMGLFHVRLLEASNLKRSHWSALALGPVKHLGLSKAHGAVSAFCTFSLDCHSAYNDENDDNDDNDNDPNNSIRALRPGDGDRKPAAKRRSSSSSNTSQSKQQQQHHHHHQPKIVSPVVHADNNPVWEKCEFEFPLKKGALYSDGLKIALQVRVQEDATAVEHFLPGILPGGDEDSRLLGIGALDLTQLCLGETVQGQVLPGVLDAWVPISLQGQDQHDHDDHHHGELPFCKDDPLAPPVKKKHHHSSDDNDKSSDSTGMVRVLVSYQPIGLEPQSKDIVALEAFARRNPTAASCRPLLSPLLPLTVLERRGSYLLCEYQLQDHQHHHNNNRKACVRLHRNAVFVIERQNLVDAAHNLALLPVDVMVSTPAGQAAVQALGPVVAAGRELLMPAWLSFKLVWMAGRTTTLAGLSGVQALGGTLWQEGASSLTASHRRNSNSNGSNHGGSGGGKNGPGGGGGPPPIRRDGRTATAQYVQL